MNISRVSIGTSNLGVFPEVMGFPHQELSLVMIKKFNLARKQLLREKVTFACHRKTGITRAIGPEATKVTIFPLLFPPSILIFCVPVLWRGD